MGALVPFSRTTGRQATVQHCYLPLITARTPPRGDGMPMGMKHRLPHDAGDHQAVPLAHGIGIGDAARRTHSPLRGGRSWPALQRKQRSYRLLMASEPPWFLGMMGVTFRGSTTPMPVRSECLHDSSSLHDSSTLHHSFQPNRPTDQRDRLRNLSGHPASPGSPVWITRQGHIPA